MKRKNQVDLSGKLVKELNFNPLIEEIKELSGMDLKFTTDIEDFKKASGKPYGYLTKDKLVKLNLDGCHLKKLPNSLWNFTSLEHLDLGFNDLVVLPEAIENLSSLKELNLGFNFNLRSLPESITNLKMLKTLDLTRLFDIDIPSCIKNMEKSGLKISGLNDFEIDDTGSFLLELIIKKDNEFRVPEVIDYEDEELRKTLRNPDEIVIKENKISILFDYPLDNEVSLEFENKDGFTRMDLFRIIYEGYKKIYDEEEQEVGDPGFVPGLANRARSNGKYGIWGHYMSDLCIEEIQYNSQTKEICMFIGS